MGTFMSGRARPAVSGTVAPLHQPVNDGLGMDQNVQALRLEIEQVVSLDQFEALVHQGGGVDVDLGAHGPDRMSRSLRWASAIAMRSFVQVRNGPPDAVIIAFSTSRFEPAARA